MTVRSRPQQRAVYVCVCVSLIRLNCAHIGTLKHLYHEDKLHEAVRAVSITRMYETTC